MTDESPFDVAEVRAQFPALGGSAQRVFLDAPGGTQAPRRVIDAIAGALESGISNLGGPFQASEFSHDIVEGAREAVARLVNAADPSEIVFGPSMTALNLALSRGLSKGWQPGDEVIVTDLDHDANVSPWRIAAGEAGAAVRVARFDDHEWTVLPEAIQELLMERTRLVAITHASNVIGSVVDVAAITAAAHRVGALVVVDAVHYGPHGLIDVRESGCDFLLASSYKFFGPHAALLYGRGDLLATADPVRITAAANRLPDIWERGTPSIEALAGVAAAVEYLSSLSEGRPTRASLAGAMAAIRSHEETLGAAFIAGVEALDGVSILGRSSMQGRVPTFAVDVAGVHPGHAAEWLGRRGVFTWAGDHYALGVVERLGRSDRGGVLRIGFVHYNTTDEVALVLEALGELASGSG